LESVYLKIINDRLRPYISLVKDLPGEGAVLERTARLMTTIGNPQDSLRVIHIAGTSGKTSTTYYISSLLLQAGCSVGQLVSPHVDTVTERVQLNGQQLTNKEFLELLEMFLNIIEKSGVTASYFEVLYGFGFWVFKQKGVDYAVIETGIGGKYDATNIADREDKLCVITDIGYDHMEVLGTDIKQIAAQKAGIIHKFNPVVVASQSSEILTVIKDRAKRCSSSLVVVKDKGLNSKKFPPDMPFFQRHNWLLSKAAYDYLYNRDHLNKLHPSQLAFSQKTYIPGRMEIVTIKDKTVIMDGAHNTQKLEALFQSIIQLYPGKMACVIISLKWNKSLRGLGEILKPIADQVIVTKFKTTKDLPTNAADPDVLIKIFINEGIKSVVYEADPDNALKKALSSKNDLVIITGSFYLLSQIRASGLVK